MMRNKIELYFLIILIVILNCLPKIGFSGDSYEIIRNGHVYDAEDDGKPRLPYLDGSTQLYNAPPSEKKNNSSTPPKSTGPNSSNSTSQPQITQSQQSGLTIIDNRGQRTVIDNAPKIEANNMTGPINLLTGTVQQKGAPTDGAGTAQFTGATTGIAGTLSTISAVSNSRRGDLAGKRANVYEEAAKINEGALSTGNYNSAPALQSVITEQRAAAAAYQQQKRNLRMQGAMEFVAGAGMIGNSIANFLAAKKLNDGGGTPNEPGNPLGDDLPVLGPIDLPPDDLGDNEPRDDDQDRFPSDDDAPKQELAKEDGKKEDTGSGGGGGGSGLSAGGAGKFEDDPLADKLDDKKEKPKDSGAEEKVLGSYDGGGRDLAGLGAGDIEGLLANLGGDDKLNSDGLDDLLASLMPPEGEENALFGPNLDPNKINEQDIDLFASIKKTHLVFYDEWKKFDEKKKKGEPDKPKVADTGRSPRDFVAGDDKIIASRPGNEVKGEKNED